jgi:hypothetical protein
MLKLADLRKTTRRAGAGDLRVVYPRFLRDRALAPRIEMAIRYLERMLGHARSELDAEVIVQLFGDHKLARCIVACLAASYRHRPRTFAEVLAEPRAAALAARGIADPSALRLWLFKRANASHPGFVGGAERAAFLSAAGEELGLRVEEIEELLVLDAPANAVLVRAGPVPTPDDVIARFNAETATALLANASVVRLKLARAVPDASPIRALCESAAVRAELGSRELLLHGRQDALENWTRHGARVAALVVDLLACGLPARSGEAIVAAPTGGEWLFRMDAEILTFLGAPAVVADVVCTPAALLAARERMAPLAGDVAALRRSGAIAGWGLRRAAGPLALAEGVWPVLFTLAHGNERVALVPAPTTDAAAARLAAIAERVPLVALAAAETSADQAPSASLPVLRYADRGDATELPALLARAIERVDRRAAHARLDAALDEASAAGVLTEGRLAERLGCDEELLPARLAEPPLRAALAGRGLRYVEGFGLCTAEVLARAQAASADVAHLRDNPAVGPAWLLRVLGRKLREVTGASEGIECLIAYLGAA